MKQAAALALELRLRMRMGTENWNCGKQPGVIESASPNH